MVANVKNNIEKFRKYLEDFTIVSNADVFNALVAVHLSSSCLSEADIPPL